MLVKRKKRTMTRLVERRTTGAGGLQLHARNKIRKTSILVKRYGSSSEKAEALEDHVSVSLTQKSKSSALLLHEEVDVARKQAGEETLEARGTRSRNRAEVGASLLRPDEQRTRTRQHHKDDATGTAGNKAPTAESQEEEWRPQFSLLQAATADDPYVVGSLPDPDVQRKATTTTLTTITSNWAKNNFQGQKENGTEQEQQQDDGPRGTALLTRPQAKILNRVSTTSTLVAADRSKGEFSLVEQEHRLKPKSGQSLLSMRKTKKLKSESPQNLPPSEAPAPELQSESPQELQPSEGAPAPEQSEPPQDLQPAFAPAPEHEVVFEDHPELLGGGSRDSAKEAHYPSRLGGENHNLIGTSGSVTTPGPDDKIKNGPLLGGGTATSPPGGGEGNCLCALWISLTVILVGGGIAGAIVWYVKESRKREEKRQRLQEKQAKKARREHLKQLKLPVLPIAPLLQPSDFQHALVGQSDSDEEVEEPESFLMTRPQVLEVQLNRKYKDRFVFLDVSDRDYARQSHLALTSGTDTGDAVDYMVSTNSFQLQYELPAPEEVMDQGVPTVVLFLGYTIPIAVVRERPPMGAHDGVGSNFSEARVWEVFTLYANIFHQLARPGEQYKTKFLFPFGELVQSADNPDRFEWFPGTRSAYGAPAATADAGDSTAAGADNSSSAAGSTTTEQPVNTAGEAPLAEHGYDSSRKTVDASSAPTARWIIYRPSLSDQRSTSTFTATPATTFPGTTTGEMQISPRSQSLEFPAAFMTSDMLRERNPALRDIREAESLLSALNTILELGPVRLLSKVEKVKTDANSDTKTTSEVLVAQNKDNAARTTAGASARSISSTAKTRADAAQPLLEESSTTAAGGTGETGAAPVAAAPAASSTTATGDVSSPGVSMPPTAGVNVVVQHTPKAHSTSGKVALLSKQIMKMKSIGRRAKKSPKSRSASKDTATAPSAASGATTSAESKSGTSTSSAIIKGGGASSTAVPSTKSAASSITTNTPSVAAAAPSGVVAAAPSQAHSIIPSHLSSPSAGGLPSHAATTTPTPSSRVVGSPSVSVSSPSTNTSQISATHVTVPAPQATTSTTPGAGASPPQGKQVAKDLSKVDEALKTGGAEGRSDQAEGADHGTASAIMPKEYKNAINKSHNKDRKKLTKKRSRSALQPEGEGAAEEVLQVEEGHQQQDVVPALETEQKLQTNRDITSNTGTAKNGAPPQAGPNLRKSGPSIISKNPTSNTSISALIGAGEVVPQELEAAARGAVQQHAEQMQNSPRNIKKRTTAPGGNTTTTSIRMRRPRDRYQIFDNATGEITAELFESHALLVHTGADLAQVLLLLAAVGGLDRHVVGMPAAPAEDLPGETTATGTSTEGQGHDPGRRSEQQMRTGGA
ncbi:unnamed protein product [Amoebophrya sp. A120]|nr:unnamed protein product [Amoebophrya sp. A120]|eukprot:GSA120T00001945001.1